MHSIPASECITTFKAEDFVGQVSVVGHPVRFGKAATRVCQELTQKYLILLQLQLTRPGFGTLAEDDCDPWTHTQMGIHALPLAKKGVRNRPWQKVHISLTPHFERKVAHLRLQKMMQQAAKIYWFPYWFGQGKAVYFLWIFQVVFWLIFMGSKSIGHNWKKTRCRSIGFRILIRINRRCSGYLRQMEWKNRKTNWYEAVSSAINSTFWKEVLQNFFVFDGVKTDEVSQNCSSFDVVNVKNWWRLESRRIASFSSLQIDRSIDR